MFGLWYLSFVIDEIRKRIGYPPLFGTASDMKPPAVAAPVVKPQPIVPPPTPPQEVPPPPSPVPEKLPPTPEPLKPDDKPLRIAPAVPLPPIATLDTVEPEMPIARPKRVESPTTPELIKSFEIPERLKEAVVPDMPPAVALPIEIPSKTLPNLPDLPAIVPEMGDRLKSAGDKIIENVNEPFATAPSVNDDSLIGKKAKALANLKDASNAFLAEEANNKANVLKSSPISDPQPTKRYRQTLHFNPTADS